jgi:alpha-amylase/alpha-mannosidase (GH57 family)
MKYWTMLLHFYQPPTQELKITKSVLENCYLPLLRMLSVKSGFGLTLNISGSLMIQLKKSGANEFFDLIKKLIADGKIEMVNSVMYHPLMPITPQDVLERQIAKNSQALRDLFGIESTAGFFPPELAVNKEILGLVKSDYIFIDENAPEPKSGKQASIALLDGKYLLINNRQVGEMFRSYPQRLSAQTVIDLVQKSSIVIPAKAGIYKNIYIDSGSEFIPPMAGPGMTNEENLIVTANDAELFGHHYSERLQVLADLLDSKEIKFIRASDAINKFGDKAKTVSGISDSTWQDCNSFDLWNKNILQEEYLELLKTVYGLTKGNLEGVAEDLLDQAYSSCYLYWLSNWPWWHPDLVGTGARSLIKCVRMSNIDNQKKSKAEEAYHLFLNKMWQYHWSGKVEVKYKEWQSQI